MTLELFSMRSQKSVPWIVFRFACHVRGCQLCPATPLRLQWRRSYCPVLPVATLMKAGQCLRKNFAFFLLRCNSLSKKKKKITLQFHPQEIFWPSTPTFSPTVANTLGAPASGASCLGSWTMWTRQPSGKVSARCGSFSFSACRCFVS